ncbi:CRISPR-associated protein, Cmr3 family [Seinonella peptonophila]|uniref:CRISPR-associated protein, Cmr3 family n=1 Tax=Seinonella peptonophila TaxID=112248 RepID=A0A1M5A163_9BACL|nr:type III-B CRISPR module-associated Cmr3 family protein [Seinonella peptonophila]SHF24039.1 CRISPR-associated protein, Cmr3 family [Seinonella peptonophila]
MREQWIFHAIDTLFFRDGTPFQLGEPGAMLPRSHFPPTFMTLQGAVRMALAKRHGWRKGKEWPHELGSTKDLGQLQITGPYLRYKNKILYPAPSVLFSHREDAPLVRLSPGLPVDCDLGAQIRLPQLPSGQKGGAPLQAWLTRQGMEAVLAGEVPTQEQIFRPHQLWQEELRVGIGRDQATRTTNDGELYSIYQVRPATELEIVVDIDNIPDGCTFIKSDIISLGGEGRAASISIHQATSTPLPSLPKLNPSGNGWIYYTLSLLNSSDVKNLDQAIKSGQVETEHPIPGECISASIGKLVQAGGWDSENKQSRPLKPLLPSGSTWFFRARHTEQKQIEALHGTLCGSKSLWGQGQLVVGTWSEQEDFINEQQ